tara:strand:+ start:265 stop:864 length:600 start_codon:yes stop_codon:yes gene_type:complete
MYKKVLQCIRSVVNEYSDIQLVDSILNSVNDNQIENKKWLVESLDRYYETVKEFPNLEGSPKTVIAAGWYGLAGHFIKKKYNTEVTSFDMDPMCKIVGQKLFPNVRFQTSTIEEFNFKQYQIIICTSCEHISDKVINDFIAKKHFASIVVLQSNNYFSIKDHINCKNSLLEFENSVKLKTLWSSQKNFGEYDRYVVIGL